MPLNKEDIWADLRYALDELDRPPRDIHNLLTDAANLDAQSDDEFYTRILLIGTLSTAYSKAKSRADTRNAHEAIERGLKAILIDGGMPGKQVRSRGHELHLLLEDIKQHNPPAFKELERCFDSTIQYLERVTTIQHNTNIVDYFQKHGKAKVFEASRYESLEGRDNENWGMIGQIYREIIRALLSLIFGWTPKDIDSRIEDEATKAILSASKLDPGWDAAGWLIRGHVRHRLEVIENLENNKVLSSAVRRCARESKDSAIKYWAQRLRHNLIAARRQARVEHRAG